MELKKFNCCICGKEEDPTHEVKTTGSSQEIIVDFAILPDYDELLARYNDLEVAQAETQSGM